MAQESWNRDTSDGTGCQPPEGPSLCSNNCGFLGCSATMNLCSKCYRELVLKQGNHFPSLPSHVDKALTSENILPPSKEPFLRMDLALASPSSTCSAPLLEGHDSSEPVMIPNVDAGPPSTQISSKRDALSAFSSAKEGASSEAVTAAAASPTRLGALHTKRHTGNRCLTCQKRVGLLGFKCRCGDLFCATHRYSDKHSCSFDYKAAGREAIAKANPVVKAEKVVRL